MKHLFTAAQWSLIDLASMFGLDKKPFEERLAWGREQLPLIRKCKGMLDLSKHFQDKIENADEPEIFTASLLNVWDIVNGNPTGHYIELDAAASGPQLLSVATRCIQGMTITGAISDSVPDLYTSIFGYMRKEVPNLAVIKRRNVKKATVPYVYGSGKAPKTVFGDFHDLFTKSYYKAVPRAEVVKNLLINAWDSEAEYYEWELPDGHTAHIKVVRNNSEVYYYNGKRFTYVYEEVGAKQKGDEGTKALAARVTHSLDAFVLREVDARCDYNETQLRMAKEAIESCLKGETQLGTMTEVKRLETISKKFKMVSIRGAEEIKRGYLADIDHMYLRELLAIVDSVLEEDKPHQLKLIHDGFGSLPNHVNSTKTHYNNILAEVYIGEWLPKVVQKLTGINMLKDMEKPRADIIRKLRNNHYAIS